MSDLSDILDEVRAGIDQATTLSKVVLRDAETLEGVTADWALEAIQARAQQILDVAVIQYDILKRAAATWNRAVEAAHG